MKIAKDIIMYVVVFSIAIGIAELAGISEFVLLPWSWFVIMAVRTYRGDFEKVENKKFELSKLFAMSVILSTLALVADLFWY